MTITLNADRLTLENKCLCIGRVEEDAEGEQNSDEDGEESYNQFFDHDYWSID